MRCKSAPCKNYGLFRCDVTAISILRSIISVLNIKKYVETLKIAVWVFLIKGEKDSIINKKGSLSFVCIMNMN